MSIFPACIGAVGHCLATTRRHYLGSFPSHVLYLATPSVAAGFDLHVHPMPVMTSLSSGMLVAGWCARIAKPDVKKGEKQQKLPTLIAVDEVIDIEFDGRFVKMTRKVLVLNEAAFAAVGTDPDLCGQAGQVLVGTEDEPAYIELTRAPFEAEDQAVLSRRAPPVQGKVASSAEDYDQRANPWSSVPLHLMKKAANHLFA